MPEPSLAENIAAVRQRLAAAAAAVARQPAEITLVAVSKSHDEAAVRAALAAGQRVFGENRVQEAAGKFAALRSEGSDLELHLVGPLQTNKAEQAVALFDVIQTLDRLKLAQALARASDKTGRRPRCFVQVNTGAEPQKAGVDPAALAALLIETRSAGLAVEGLMCIPPVDQPPAPHFQLLRGLGERHGLRALSMGMSADFETAIHLGATHVRVGTAIFGARALPAHEDAAQ
jgi:pyridoxal phosphate enzyme (YggS family)